MKGLALGQTARLTRTFRLADLNAYRVLSADNHLQFGRSPGREVVPGPLLGGLFSCLLGTRLPGRGTNWLKQTLSFPHAAHVGEVITATVEIIRLRPEKELVNLQTICTNPAGDIVCHGEALVLVRDLERDLERDLKRDLEKEPDPEVLMNHPA